MWPLLPTRLLPSFVCFPTILRIPQLCHCFGGTINHHRGSWSLVIIASIEMILNPTPLYPTPRETVSLFVRIARVTHKCNVNWTIEQIKTYSQIESIEAQIKYLLHFQFILIQSHLKYWFPSVVFFSQHIPPKNPNHAMRLFHAAIQDIDSYHFQLLHCVWGGIKSIIFPLAQFIWRSRWNYLMIISNGQWHVM